jgi:hypothetical protein
VHYSVLACLTVHYSVSSACLTMHYSVSSACLTVHYSVSSACLTAHYSVSSACLTVQYSVSSACNLAVSNNDRNRDFRTGRARNTQLVDEAGAPQWVYGLEHSGPEFEFPLGNTSANQF